MAGYHALIQRVDQFCSKISEEHKEQIACTAGCSGCCQHISVSPVEAESVRIALEKLPAELLALLARRVDTPADAPCPLLVDGLCTVYESRPLICRTHGLPILIEDEKGRRVDFCRLNFSGVESLPGGSIINLETLNSALAAINAAFAAESLQHGDPCARVPLAEIIRLVAGSAVGH